MNLRWPGQATVSSLRNLTHEKSDSKSYNVFPRLPTNETKLTHTYLPTYVPNKTAPNETGEEGRASL